MNEPISKKRSIFLIIILTVVSYAAVQKGVVWFFNMPEKTGFMTNTDYNLAIKTNYPYVAPFFIVLGIAALLVAIFIATPPILKQTLGTLGALWFFKGYSLAAQGPHEKLMQFIFLLIVLAVLCYFIFRNRQIKKS